MNCGLVVGKVILWIGFFLRVSLGGSYWVVSYVLRGELVVVRRRFWDRFFLDY